MVYRITCYNRNKCHFFYNLIYEKDNIHSLEVKDSYTNDKINMDDIKATIVNDSSEIP